MEPFEIFGRAAASMNTALLLHIAFWLPGRMEEFHSHRQEKFEVQGPLPSALLRPHSSDGNVTGDEVSIGTPYS